MLSKPFKPLLIKKTVSTPQEGSSEPPVKRRRISDEDERPPSQASESWDPRASSFKTKPATSIRKPLVVVRNPPEPDEPRNSDRGQEGPEGYYMVLWRKVTTKKNKTWDDDGVLAVRNGYATLQDLSGNSMGRTAFAEPLLSGSTLSIGGKDVEVESLLSKEDYLAGRPFLKSTSAPIISKTAPTTPVLPEPANVDSVYAKPNLSLKAQMKAAMAKEKENAKKTLNVAAATSKAGTTAFRNPVKETTFVPQAPTEKPNPRHNPDVPNALVFKRPKRAPKDKQIVDVVLDPIIGKHLREHQREGVKFLYECVMGLRDFGGGGCILADEMGLGKTLQTIALLWTLLKQNPVYRAAPVIKKALIVCPVTLISNWRKEFKKWLPNERIGVFVADGTKTRLTDFTTGPTYQVMIIGYERLRSVAEDLTRGSGVDIVIADEGHRLKTEKNKSAKAIQSLNTSKRIILSGTPIQNDLSEFFVMANFVNDGCLGTYKSFVKNFESPILKSRQPNALEKDIELGEARSEEMAQTTSPFILRRTADILSKYLPPKSEYVLFCNPTPEQAIIYKAVIGSPMFQSALGSSETALQLITILKKLCNSPSLLVRKNDDKDSTTSDTLDNLIGMLPSGISKTFRNQASTKIRMLDQLLHQIRTTTDEKVVLVSNYTSTLDLVASLLTSTALPYLRLDGSTPATKRQGLVDDFNRSKPSHCFAFLLSAKAGGMGLNLIGASRLILFDVDWNPATDDQAMARIHRQGQKKHCKIYRFVIKGGLEERIWQRQVVKRGLADSIMEGGSAAGGGGGGGKKGVAAFSREELKDLFRLDESLGLRTHELIGCECGGMGTSSTNNSDLATPRDNGSRLGIDHSEGLESDASSEVSEDLPDLTTLTKGSRLTSSFIDDQEHKIASGTHPQQANARKKQKQEMQALMEYVHLNTTQLSDIEEGSDAFLRLEEVVDDDCLFEVLRDNKATVAGGIAYMFKKTSGSKLEQKGGLVEVRKELVNSTFFKCADVEWSSCTKMME